MTHTQLAAAVRTQEERIRIVAAALERRGDPLGPELAAAVTEAVVGRGLGVER